MKVRIFHSGVVRHIDNYNGEILIQAGQAEVTTDPVTSLLPKYQPAPPVQPIWSVSIEGNVRKELAIRMELPGVVALYTGDPKSVNAKKVWPGGSRYTNGFGRTVPDDIVQQYARQWKSSPDLRAVGGSANPDVIAAFSSHENEVNKVNQDQWDSAVASGNVPFVRRP